MSADIDLKSRPYNIAEIIILGILITESVVRIVISIHNNKKVII